MSEPTEVGAVETAAKGPEAPEADPARGSARPPILYAATFVVATCGLVYELVAGAMASYLLGDSVTQFSLVIGLYLSAMGVGSWLSRFLGGNLFARFIHVEVLVGVLGGLSATLLFASFATTGSVRPLLFTLVFLIGTGVGLEIPLLLAILKDEVAFRDLVARVLFFDYLGALAASLLFPLILVPTIGLVRTAFVFGLANVACAALLTFIFAERVGTRTGRFILRLECVVAALLLGGGLAANQKIEALAEQQLYDAQVLHAVTTPYQRIAVTRWRQDVRLYLNGALQFSSRDEHRYHEALVHPGMAAGGGAGVRRVLVLGGGDGLAVREVLKYPAVERVVLVDIDPAVTKLFREEPMLVTLNGGSLNDARVEVVNADAFIWLEENDELFDVILADMPDPSNLTLGKLYTRTFYRLCRRHLSESGAMVVQSTSPFVAKRSFWCIDKTIRSAELSSFPFHCYVPSFGDWGYILATKRPAGRPESVTPGIEMRWLDDEVLGALFVFGKDQRPPDGEIEVNRIGDLELVRYYDAEWRRAD